MKLLVINLRFPPYYVLLVRWFVSEGEFDCAGGKGGSNACSSNNELCSYVMCRAIFHCRMECVRRAGRCRERPLSCSGAAVTNGEG